MDYRYRRFSPRVVLDELRHLRSGLPIGAPMPAFALPTTHGTVFDASLVVGRMPIVLVTASIT